MEIRLGLLALGGGGGGVENRLCYQPTHIPITDGP